MSYYVYNSLFWPQPMAIFFFVEISCIRRSSIQYLQSNSYIFVYRFELSVQKTENKNQKNSQHFQICHIFLQYNVALLSVKWKFSNFEEKKKKKNNIYWT